MWYTRITHIRKTAKCPLSRSTSCFLRRGSDGTQPFNPKLQLHKRCKISTIIERIHLRSPRLYLAHTPKAGMLLSLPAYCQTPVFYTSTDITQWICLILGMFTHQKPWSIFPISSKVSDEAAVTAALADLTGQFNDAKIWIWTWLRGQYNKKYFIKTKSSVAWS